MAPPKAIQKGTTLMPSLARKGISTRSKNVTNDQNADIIGKKGIGGTIIGKRKADASPIKNDRVKRSALGNLTNAVSYGNNNMDIDLLKNVTNLNGVIAKKNKPNLTRSKRCEDNEQHVNQVKNSSLSIDGSSDVATVIVNSTSSINTNNGVNGGVTKMPTLTEFQIPRSISLGLMPTARPTKVMTRASLRAITSNVSKKQTTSTAFESTAIKSKDVIDVAAKPTTRRISNDFEKTDDSLYMSALEET